MEIKLGDVVNRADGLRGKVIAQMGDGKFVVKYEDEQLGALDPSDLSSFWLVGKTVIGNRTDPETVREEIVRTQEQIAKLKAREAVLRKQHFRLVYQMREGWEEEKLAMQAERTEQNATAVTAAETEEAAEMPNSEDENRRG